MTETSICKLVEPLKENSQKWSNLSYQTKLNFLLGIQKSFSEILEEWKNASAEVRKLKESASFGYLVSGGTSGVIAHLVYNYQSLISSGKCRPFNTRTTKSGKTVYSVFPDGFLQGVIAQGTVGEVYVDKEGQTLPNEKEAGVCAILAPGNFEGPVDILHKLFVDNKVVAWKPHSVNEKATLPFIKKAFAALISAGFMVVIEDSSPKAGGELLNSPVVTEAIMTGGAGTYNAIVWGSPQDQDKNKQNDTKVFSKKFEAELGAVSPVIVVPGIWTDVELDAYAETIVLAKISNGGAICASPQVIILDQDWPQREKFLKMIKDKLANVPRESGMYYPGGEDRQKKAQTQSENTEVLGKETPGPVLFLNDLKEDAPFLREECFALAIGNTSLKAGNDPKTFVDMATDFANNKLFGTLSCSVLCCPSSEQAVGGADYIIEKLNYGAIGYNLVGMQVFFFQSLPWGAYPGHSEKDIQSGQGKVNNPFCFSTPVKSVLRGSFMNEGRLKKSKNPALEYSRFTHFLINPGFFSLGKLLSAGLFNF